MARKRGITLDDIVASASRLADEWGWEALTLAGVARDLGIRSPSLYAHVEGLEGLRRALALHAARDMTRCLEHGAEGRKGEEALHAILRAYRRYAQRHPGRYAAVQRAVPPDQDDELYEALGSVVVPVVTALAEAGVEPERRIHLVRALRSALHGFVVLEAGGGFGRPEPKEESFDHLVELLLAGVRGRRPGDRPDRGA
jgi:AcrR family transcriptional regulator